ncbi:MAG: AmmeMemoRadiSam system protein A [Clostridiales bacterium]|nr:AmmeMemoRadiSam system protein A [Clostridiales bacterium]
MSILTSYIVPHPPLIVPEVGRGQENKIMDTINAYHNVAREISEIKPETIVVITPHSVIYQDYIHISPGKKASGNLKQFGNFKTSIEVDYDVELVSKLEELAIQNEISAGTLGEKSKKLDHGTIVPLYFINQCFEDYKIVRISISGLSFLDHYRFGKCIKESVESLRRKVVIIASGDLSHRLKNDGPYSYAEEGPIFDKKVTEYMKTADFMGFLNFDEGFCELAGECGLRGFIIMAGALDGYSLESDFLSYEGTFGVGYAVCKYRVAGDAEERHFDLRYEEELAKRMERIKVEEDEYVKLARKSLESYVKNRKYIDIPEDVPKELLENKAGVFVTLNKDGRLRGCIGTISPVEDCIANEIIRNAVSAGTGDPRFDPVTIEELPELVYSVDVLGEAEEVSDESELDALKYGVIVSKGFRRGLLLPNLEGVKTPRQQIEIALQKAGISPNESYKLERFEVVRHT